MFQNINILETLQFIIIIFFSIWFHEYAHAIVSYKLWDPTPKYQWRLTLNPIAHIDPVGWIFILLTILWWWWIGRWKPVEINPHNYKNPERWELLVALAWPAMNLAISIVAILIVFVYWRISGFELNDVYFADWFSSFFSTVAITNIWLAIFNLIPIRPLDWFTVLKVYFHELAYKMIQYRQYISIIMLILILWPTRNGFVNIFWSIQLLILKVLSIFFGGIFY